MNNITYRIKAPEGSNGGSYNFSILCKDDLNSASEPHRIDVSLKLDSDKDGWSYRFTVLSIPPKEIAYLGLDLETNRRTTGNNDRKSTLRHALSQLADLMESLGDTEAGDLLTNWFNKQF